MSGDELNTLERKSFKSYDSGIDLQSKSTEMDGGHSEKIPLDQNLDAFQEDAADESQSKVEHTDYAHTRKRKDGNDVDKEEHIYEEVSTETADTSRFINHKRPKHLKEATGNTESIENTILRWAKEEKRLISMKENLTTNTVDFGDYSILMYETQDAFNHCRNLRLKLQVSEEQVRLKTNQCNMLMDQRKHMKKEIQQQRQENESKVKSLQRRLNSAEQRLINVYGENEWLQGKYEEVKTLCVKYREKYLSSTQLLKTRVTMNSALELGNNANEHKEGEEDEDNEDVEKTMLLHDHEDVVQVELQSEDADNYDERPRRDTMVNQQPIEEDMHKTIHEITTMATRNDLILLSITKDCQKALEENSKRINQIFTENQETADKLERWIDNYMILKRKLEDGTEIYKRELKKSWSAEKEYSEQIKALCETINKMTLELTEGKTKLTSYMENFEKVPGYLKKMETQFDQLRQQSESRLNDNDNRLTNLMRKCQKLKEKQQDSPPNSGRRRSSSSRRLSKTIFNLKRRLSESNEGAR